jgi:hypothetical protein
MKMKKTFILAAMAVAVVLGFTACGSDDEDYVAPKHDVELPLPNNAAEAVSFEEIENMTSAGKELAGITFTETGNAIVEVSGKFISANYTFANGIYTLTGAAKGTVANNAYAKSRGTTSDPTTITINLEVIVDGQSYNFNGDAAADVQTATEMLKNVNLNNICRKWNFKDMSLSLDGDVKMMKVYQSGDLSQLGKDANENGAGLTYNELAELNKTVVSIEFTKTGKLFITYKENGKEITVCATWDSSSFEDFRIGEISDANKFLKNGSKITVIYNATGGCTMSFFTEITGSKNYKAELTINLVDASK